MKLLNSLVLLAALCAITANGKIVEDTPDPSTVYNLFQLSSSDGGCDPAGTHSPDANVNVSVDKCRNVCNKNIKISKGTSTNQFTFQTYNDNSCSQATSDQALSFTCSDNVKKQLGTSIYSVICSTGSDSTNPTSTPSTTPSATPTVTPSTTPTVTPTVTPSTTPTVAPTVPPTTPPSTTTGSGSTVVASFGLIVSILLASLAL
ncbi:ponticulin-related protein [Dictyostelium discoideum AX4]|uniref:Ponticulin-like protein H n=1 Tax=Dictyostelium discoideum TaxID=44689 RepID=PONH_DICDI|nr:ponticulin-related protein [Dictyostelium discoideum AX4]Q54LM2.1 RecName: Full=Ponticulin-like protein H; Flags: Precursor [Dictyostelium discoideum]EAL64042.1 ponticulin-related protein [Dictyostelium discoideum AX4]|eukprot:XP_637539.1 ponticulin-related protein [Dictyostelium discoideum AX4]